jgi:ABC-type antimicrobial peptide transport system permease subunit
VWSVNPNLPLEDVRTVQDIYGRSMARTSFTLVLLTLAAAMALLLGVVGIYGVISYSVSQKTREIGIRMALGASQRTVRQMFVRHGLLLTSIGVGFGVSALDPVTYCSVPVALVAAAWLASYLPARRATVIEPVDALRAE